MPNTAAPRRQDTSPARNTKQVGADMPIGEKYAVKNAASISAPMTKDEMTDTLRKTLNFQRQSAKTAIAMAIDTPSAT